MSAARSETDQQTSERPAIPAEPAKPGKTERRFFVGMSVVIALIVFTGFAPTYFLRGMFGLKTPDVGAKLDYGNLTPLLHIHGFLFTSWILLFVVQTVLIAKRRTDVHRKLGWVGAGIAVSMMVAGFNVALWSARRGFTPPGAPPPLIFFVIPMFDLAAFSSFAVLGVLLRKKAETHKRLMLLASIGMLAEPIARIWFITPLGILAFFALQDLFVVACMVYDRRTRGRIHPAFKWGGLALILSQPARLAIASTGAWMAFATWITS